MNRADHDLAFLLRYENVAWYETGSVRILDRRIYPIRTEFVTCTTHQAVAQAIADMVTQSGGPYTAAAMGMALAAYEARNLAEADQRAYLEQAAHTLSHARPTTSKRMEQITGRCLATALAAIAEGRNTADAVAAQTIADMDDKYRRIEQTGRHLAAQFPKGGTVMTQCYGETVIGMMLRACRESGNEIRVICPETRPYFQGARLTASCVCDMGFDVTVITDNMPAWTMHEKHVDVFTSAADVITMDGHIVNKVGTLQIALAAQYWGIPYYVTGEPDPAHPTLASVQIEERNPDLAVDAFGVRTAMEGVKGYYPAFDITPPKLCNGVVTHRGLFSPYGLSACFDPASKEPSGLWI